MSGFVDQYLDNAEKFYELAMNQFDFLLKIQGTDCQVVRVKDSSPRKEVFGTTYSSDLIGDTDTYQFKYRILINLNDMRKVYQQIADSFEVLDNKRVLELGDLVIFSWRKKEYKFKIVDFQAFSPTASILYRYTLSGYQEVTNN